MMFTGKISSDRHIFADVELIFVDLNHDRDSIHSLEYYLLELT